VLIFGSPPFNLIIMKKRIKILKPVQSYIIGNVYRLSGHFANKLIEHGKAVAVPNVKEEKKVITTKEEKFVPETKEEIPPPKEIVVLPISKLRLAISDMSYEELDFILHNDERKSAKALAQKELLNR